MLELVFSCCTKYPDIKTNKTKKKKKRKETNLKIKGEEGFTPDLKFQDTGQHLVNSRSESYHIHSQE